MVALGCGWVGVSGDLFFEDLPFPETNSSPLKVDGWNTIFLLGGLFSVAMLVSGRVIM